MRHAALAAMYLFAPASASAAEVCGNGLDDNGNSMADEGCWPDEVLKICENPLSCKMTGHVAYKTGALVYQLPADIAPAVPYGSPLTFAPAYMSAYSPPSTN